MELGLTDHYVLVTGSSRGIGLSIAESFLKENANVILTGLNKKTLDQALKTFRARYKKRKVLSFAGDLRQQKVMLKLKEFIGREAGQLNHLVCNIGSGESVLPLQEDLKETQRMLEVNFLISVMSVQAMLPLLEKNSLNGRETTTITFIGSICGVAALGCPVAYAAAKSALEAYAKNIARPLGPKGIRVNVVSPGNIMFSGSIWEKKIKENKRAVEAMLKRDVPLQRLGNPEDVASAVVFLASNKAKFVTGANWIVDGGQVR